MKILYMGTAAAEGWPALFCSCPICRQARTGRGRNLRTRTQTLLDGDLLVDFPPDSYAHATAYGVNFGDIHTLLVTHSHMDHWFPTDFVHRNELFAHDTTGCLDIYGNEAVHQAFVDAMSIDRFEAHPVDDVICFHVVHGGETFRAGVWEITAVPADHDKREECLIYICQKDGKTVLYGHDTGLMLSQEAWALLGRHRFDLVSLDATMGLHGMGHYHMSLEDVEQFIVRLEAMGAIDERTLRVINHFSHNGGLNHEQLCEWGKRHNTLVTWDGMELDI